MDKTSITIAIAILSAIAISLYSEVQDSQEQYKTFFATTTTATELYPIEPDDFE